LVHEGDDVWVIGASNLVNATEAFHLEMTETAVSIALSDRIAYIGSQSESILIYDLNNVAEPILAGSVPAAGIPWEIELSDAVAVVLSGSNVLEFFDISDLTQPIWLSKITLPEVALDFDIERHFAYTVNRRENIQVVDFTDPVSPLLSRTINLNFGNSTVYDIDVSGRWGFMLGNVFLPDHDPTFPITLFVIDFLAPDPRFVLEVIDYHSLQTGCDLSVVFPCAYVADSYSGLIERCYSFLIPTPTPTPTPILTPTPVPTLTNERSDINSDGLVDQKDLILFQSDWHKIIEEFK